MTQAERHLETIERVINTQAEVGFYSIKLIYGTTLKLYKVVEDDYTKAYGEDGITEFSDPIEFIGVITGDDFFPVSLADTGSLQEGWLYTDDPNVKSGDRVAIKRRDNKTFSFMVGSKEDLGQTISVYEKFRLAAIAM